MKKQVHGPSQYYATDKNVFDALNQHKVDTPTILGLFEKRNTFVSPKTPREELAKSFASLTHDYYDHREIAARLGIVSRRERLTSLDIEGIENKSEIQSSINQLKENLEATGDVVHLTADGENITLNIQYSVVDYKLSEMSQLQVKDGTIEFVKTPDGYTIRNTDNEHMNDLRETLIGKIQKTHESELTTTLISLFDVPSPTQRSKFFHDLMNHLPGYSIRDVTSVYVYKSKPDDSEDNDSTDDDTHIEKVTLSGNGVSRSQLLNELLDDDNYYIVKVGWETKETLGDGHVFDIEATFSNPKDCTGFSYILKGTYPNENGVVSKRRRSPFKDEINTISAVIDAKSRQLMKLLNKSI